MAVAYRLLPVARLWAERIASAFQPGEAAEILDLCSGSGGAMPAILTELEKRGFQVRAKLTDLRPNPDSAADPRISWVAEPIDATRVSETLPGVRTMFSGFHHFRPDAAQAILRSAFDSRRAICIFESGPGGLAGIATTVLIPVNVLLLMPFARPFHWSYLIFTYLIPLLPLILFWDGLVSMLRIYSPEEMTEMTTDLRRADYQWETGRIRLRGMPAGLPYLIGRPRG